jgi:glycosyltransferase 2 family protein
MKHRNLLQTGILIAGLAGIAFVIAETVHETGEQVMPSVQSVVIAGVLALAAITASARAWAVLFRDLLTSRAKRVVLRGTFYLAQLTKYLPAGGVIQVASQLGLAPTAGVPLKRAAVAFPVSAIGALSACATFGCGLALVSDLPGWARALSALSLLTLVLLSRPFMARALDLARRLVPRTPTADQLPRQTDILAFYAWALVTIGALCGGYTVLLLSITDGVSATTVFCAFAMSWAIGFLAIPVPAGVGVREAVLVAAIPGVPTAPLLAASLALRLLTIATEVLAFVGNRMSSRFHGRAVADDISATVAVDGPVEPTTPATSGTLEA